MRIYCRGFNLYGQLNSPNKCLLDFICTIEVDFLNFYEIKDTFSVIVTNDVIKLYCNYLENNVVENKDVLHVSATDKAILLVKRSGQIFKILVENLDKVSPIPTFLDECEVIKQLRCGSKLNIIYTDNGFLYSIPEKIHFQNKNIIDIKTGREHCLLLGSSGNVYSFGRGSRGQLGLGQLDDEFSPKIIEALAGIKIASIEAGGWHSTAISVDGDLYTWGWNGNGQLGILSNSENSTVSVMAIPQVIDIPGCTTNKIHKIACGNRHTVVLLDNNLLYGCGWNKYKQLKNEEQENYTEFIFLHDFANEDVQSLVCGPWSTSVICK